MARVTIDDVARLARVSKSTVSRVMNGHYEHVSEETRRRVQDAIQRLGYRRNELAASLKTRRTRTIGMIIPSILNPFYTAVVRGAEDELRRRRFNVVVCNADEDPRREMQYAESLLSKGVDGFLIATGGGNEPFYRQLYAERVPVVAVERPIQGVPYDAVVLDDYRQALQVTRYLLDLGHRAIAFVAHSPERVPTLAQRLAGFQQAHHQRRLQPDPQLTVFLPPRPHHKAYAQLRRLLERPGRPTALFTQNASLTTLAVEIADHLGLRIPYDLSLTGFDDPPMAGFVEPPLSLIRQPGYELGARASLQLLKVMRLDLPGSGKLLELSSEFIVRNSCDAPGGDLRSGHHEHLLTDPYPASAQPGTDDMEQLSL